jgi:hypothetical protein
MWSSFIFGLLLWKAIAGLKWSNGILLGAFSIIRRCFQHYTRCFYHYTLSQLYVLGFKNALSFVFILVLHHKPVRKWTDSTCEVVLYIFLLSLININPWSNWPFLKMLMYKLWMIPIHYKYFLFLTLFFNTKDLGTMLYQGSIHYPVGKLVYIVLRNFLLSMQWKCW